jgi:GNAT superfamily N-acetyltransferase
MGSSLLARTAAKIRYYRQGLPWHYAVLRIVIDTLAQFGVRIELFHLVLEGLSLADAADQERLSQDIEVRFLTADEMAALAAIPGRQPTEANLRQRLQEGKLCLGLCQQGAPVAFTWCDLEACCFEGYPLFQLRVNEAYLFDAYTRETARGNGLAPVMRYRLYKELARLGKTRCYSLTVLFNAPAARFKAKLGARILELHVLIEVCKRWRLHRVLRRYES